MPVDLRIDTRVDLGKPVTRFELQAARPECDMKSDKASAENTGLKRKGVCFASNFNKSKSIMRRRKSRKKRNLDKKRREQQSRREQALTNAKVQKYVKEMQNRDIIQRRAAVRRVEALLTPGIADDVFVDSALGLSRSFDDLVYNSVPSEVGNEFDDFMDEIIVGNE